jgi:hypothetical protein
MHAVTTVAPEAATAVAKVRPGRLAPWATPVMFAAGGDLTKHPVVPALDHVVQAGRLPCLIGGCTVCSSGPIRSRRLGPQSRDCSIAGRTMPQRTSNYAAGSAGPEAADRLAGAPWARMAGDQVWLRTYGDPLLTWLHQPSEVAL